MTSGRWLVENYRGRLVARVLWIPVLALAVVWTLGTAAATEVGGAGWGALAGVLLVGAAGLLDDLVPVGPRGLRDHLRALLDGHMTTGILKVLVGVGSAVVVVALQPTREGWVAVAGVLLVAACTNVWNGLDVRPGRALKAFVPAALVFALLGDHADAPAVVGMLVAAVAVLPADLRERGMLGDAGSNPVGFAAGVGLYAALPDFGVLVAAAAAVALNVLADTLTLSRAIEAVPPLRWLDRLGRAPSAG